MVKLLIEKKPIEKKEPPKTKGQRDYKASQKKVITLADTPYVPKVK